MSPTPTVAAKPSALHRVVTRFKSLSLLYSPTLASCVLYAVESNLPEGAEMNWLYLELSTGVLVLLTVVIGVLSVVHKNSSARAQIYALTAVSLSSAGFHRPTRHDFWGWHFSMGVDGILTELGMPGRVYAAVAKPAAQTPAPAQTSALPPATAPAAGAIAHPQADGSGLPVYSANATQPTVANAGEMSQTANQAENGGVIAVGPIADSDASAVTVPHVSTHFNRVKRH
ncbi:hypothetical protein DFH09DRAFT_1094184 [Mycena vulgaris]|nr:hypothetical protein DFH09DRAFT_1094184 [Mycena vulgaris]